MTGHEPPIRKPEVVSLGSMLTPQTLVVGSLLFAVVLVVLLILVNRRKSRGQGTALLLVGPSDSGKTAIFSRLVYGRTTPTHTSLQPNASIANITPSKAVRIIDIPGHPRIRDQFTEYLSDAKVIAFVVDSNTISRNGVAVAEHLHHILHAITSLPPSHAVPSLVVVCNKADLLKTSASSGSATTLAVNRVKTILERELEKRRLAQTGGVGVEGLGEEGERSELGGLECGDGNSPFRFDEWDGGDVVFLGTSSRSETSEKSAALDEKREADGLSALQDYLEEQM
ncbi:hypothetical protein CC1G_01232 [Coprinopsis cinerea okayama7|uniref:Signal recognition particle receptor subunit beta n=1 Tax=Coprinopsis cinerea (strain Okayama-7 / 130 / ATCC MYA-4618 / FGSC 9003) TaxID=240176 RepID=A8NEZ3_COPC7|nr:hypothetical protein CC1G_01232 [Coprinopsis cinerea okayama7\|eukprot:XP_001833170.1 hypothetical protein CC1G_01232 [Coprinopsis cinerea okayama7\